MTERPWLKFYPPDWRADPKLRMCSLAARGLWIEMLCVMHEASPRGDLKVGVNPITNQQLSCLVGVSESEASTLLTELEESGVFSRDADGVIFSRRMRREAIISEKAKANGKLGGNPSLKGEVNPLLNPELKANGSGSGSNITTTLTEKEEASPRANDPLSRMEFGQVFWPEWPHRVSQRAAVESFIVARRKAPLDAIMDGVRRYKATKPPDRQWMNPATFLDEERWTDEPAPIDKPAGKERPHDAIFKALARHAASGSGDDERPAGAPLRVLDQRGPASGVGVGDIGIPASAHAGRR